MKRIPFVFSGTVEELRLVLYWWMLLDSLEEGTTWDYDPQRRVWRRTT